VGRKRNAKERVMLMERLEREFMRNEDVRTKFL
jgi:hypothetical protein